MALSGNWERTVFYIETIETFCNTDRNTSLTEILLLLEQEYEGESVTRSQMEIKQP
jgi:hypothetical protein